MPTDPWQYVRDIQCPAIYITGGASRIVPPETQAQLKATVPSVQVVVMPGLGHYPDQESTAEFVAIVKKFLAGESRHNGGAREVARMNHFFRAFAITGLFCGCLPLAAHHSTGSYDKTKTVPIRGVVVEISWMNPHAGMILDARDPSGKTTRWVVETASPNALVNRGWKKNDVKTGDEIAIDAWLPKQGGEGRAFARFIHLPDGRLISGLGAWDCESAAQEGCAGKFQVAPEGAK